MLGASWDPARSDVAALAELTAGGVDLAAPVLVRHHLLLPGAAAVGEAARLLADEGYRVGPDERPVAGVPPAGLPVLAVRTEAVTGLGLAQERSRMAGLAQRLGGASTGWDLLGPGAGDR